jgi:hypothetical protein
MTPSVVFNSRQFSGSTAITESWTADRDVVATVSTPFGDALISSDPNAVSADLNSANSAKVFMELIPVSTNSGVIQIPISKGEKIYVALSSSSTVVFQLSDLT